jgi:1-acyl-sn-glycerol-3-phosphate acyltransferase
VGRRLRALYLATATGGCFLFFWVGCWLLSWTALPLARLALRNGSTIDRDRLCQDLVGWGFRLFIAFMRWLRTLVFVPGKVEFKFPDGPFVLISNHPTLIDVTAILAVYPRICCVAKTELFHSSWVGRLLRYCGHIEGGSAGPMDGVAVMQQALKRLKRGQPVLIFPEGTRSPDHGLRRFKSGAFEIASRAGVPVVPVYATCEPPTLKKNLSWYGLPKKTACYNLRQLAAPAGDFHAADSRSAAARFQDLYQAEIDAGRRTQTHVDGVPSASTGRRVVS